MSTEWIGLGLAVAAFSVALGTLIHVSTKRAVSPPPVMAHFGVRVLDAPALGTVLSPEERHRETVLEVARVALGGPLRTTTAADLLAVAAFVLGGAPPSAGSCPPAVYDRFGKELCVCTLGQVCHLHTNEEPAP